MANKLKINELGLGGGLPGVSLVTRCVPQDTMIGQVQSVVTAGGGHRSPLQNAGVGWPVREGAIVVPEGNCGR